MMFETAELGQKVRKDEFKERERVLWGQLLESQRELRERSDFQVLIDFAGVHGAGKVSTVNVLNRWMDTRWIITQAYGEYSSEAQQRPDFWRYWRDLPPKGQIGLFLSGRYSQPLLDFVHKRTSKAEFERRLTHIKRFEKALADSGALILKFWMHLSRDAQQRRLKSLEKDPLESWRVTKTDWKHWKIYDRFIIAAEQLITQTNTDYAPWHIVEGEDYNYRSLKVGEIVQDAIERQTSRVRVEKELRKQNQAHSETELEPSNQRIVTIFSNLDVTKKLPRKEYKSELRRYQSELNRLHRKALKRGISTILVFEGPDAAGKGGSIRRLISAMDAPNYKVVPFAAPTDEERAQHYLWRFWRHLPRAGHIRIFDRSWYGRVLVERVEGFASESEWRRAYAEINDFESQLVEHGILLLKFWIHITKDEQLARFKARQETPYKQWKLTEEDWRNREKWEEYELAAHEMVQQTSTQSAPWILVESNNKLYERIKVIKTLCDRLNQAVSD